MAFPVNPTSPAYGPGSFPVIPSHETGSYGMAQAIQEAQEMGLASVGPGPENLPKPLTMEEQKAVIAQEIRDANQYYGGELSEQRKRALDYFHGRPFGNEKEGRSKVVTQDVLKTVRWAMPPLMRILTGGQHVTRYQPRYSAMAPPELAEEQAEQATEYVDQQWNANGGFMHAYVFLQDGLLEKTGIGKVTIDERVHRKRHTYTGLTDLELAMLFEDPSLKPVEYTRREEFVPGMGPTRLHDVTVVTQEAEPKLRWENIPNEHFLISRRSAWLSEETPFVADRKRMTKSSLIAMGLDPDLVLPLPSHDAADYDEEWLNRFYDEETSARMTGARHDVASQEVWVTDCYILMDADGDGYAERRRVLVAGSDASLVILHNEEVPRHPYYAFTPLPQSHKFYGNSLADLVMDLQLIRSQLLRLILDNAYLNISPPAEAVEGEVNLDDLLTRRPGSVIRTRQPGMLVFHQPQNLPSYVFDLYRELEDEAQQRSGITRSMHHLDVASGKNQTLGGVQELLQEAAVCIDLIARVAAETGFKDCFTKTLQVLHDNHQVRSIMRVRGKYVPIDPSKWDPQMTVDVEVALGAGQSSRRIETLGTLAGLQGNLVSAGLGGQVVTPQNVYELASELAREAGYRHTERFFTDPRTVPPPQPEPDPKLIQELSQARKRELDADRDRGKLMVDARESEMTGQAQLMQAVAALQQAAASMIQARNSGQEGRE